MLVLKQMPFTIIQLFWTCYFTYDMEGHISKSTFIVQSFRMDLYT